MSGLFFLSCNKNNGKEEIALRIREKNEKKERYLGDNKEESGRTEKYSVYKALLGLSKKK